MSGFRVDFVYAGQKGLYTVYSVFLGVQESITAWRMLYIETCVGFRHGLGRWSGGLCCHDL